MLSLNAGCCHLALGPDRELTEHVRIRIDVDASKERHRPDLNAVLVLDVSGSMRGAPLAHVVRSAQRVCQLLGDEDALGVVTFHATAGTVATVQRLDEAQRRELMRGLDKLQAGGSTNIGAGLGHAVALLPPRRRHKRHVALLMTDGHPTDGARSVEALTGLASSARQQGVSVSTLGFGANHDEDMLSAIAEATGGRYAFVPDGAVAEAAFARALGAQRDVVAEDMHLLLRAPEGVEIKKVMGAGRVSFTSRGMKVGLSDAIAGDAIEVVVELVAQTPRECGPWDLLSVSLLAQPLRGGSPFVVERAVSSVVSRVGTDAVDHEVAAAVALAHAEAARDRARRLADAGSFPEAAAAAREAHEALASLPGFTPGDGSPVDDAYQALHDDVTAYSHHPDPETYSAYRKASHSYACRSTSASAYAEACFDEALPAAHLFLIDTAETHTIKRHQLIIGRSPRCDLAVSDPSISRQHTAVQFVRDAFWVLDLGSTCGTLLNGERLRSARPLHHGDVLTVGGRRIAFRLGAPSALARDARSSPELR